MRIKSFVALLFWIWEFDDVRRTHSIDRILRSLPLNKPFSVISDPTFTKANKALEHLQKTSEKRATLPAYESQEMIRNKLPMNRWRHSSTTVSSDGQRAKIPHNYKGRPSFTSVSFSADEDERIRANYKRQQFCSCKGVEYFEPNRSRLESLPATKNH